MEMKGLTLTQPWATLVAIDQKEYETRCWNTDYRGDVAIHAAKRFPPDARALCNHAPFAQILRNYLQPFYSNENLMYCDELWKFLPTSKILCVVNLWKVWSTEHARRYEDMTRPYELNFGDYADGRYAFRMRDLRPLKEPVEARGALSLWKIDPELRAKIEAQYLAPLQGPINRDPDWRAHPNDLLNGI